MKAATAQVYKTIIERIPIRPIVGAKLLHSAASSLYLRSRAKDDLKNDDTTESLLASITLMAFIIAAHLNIDLQSAIRKQMDKYLKAGMSEKITNVMKGVM